MAAIADNSATPVESYVVEIDGKIDAAYGFFVEAIKAGLKLKQQHPGSRIKVHEAGEGTPH